MLSDKKRKNILGALKQEKTYEEIARKYHTSKSTIRQLKRENVSEPITTTMPKKESPEFLSFLSFGSLLLLWALLIQGKEFTTRDFLLTLIFFLDAVYIFFELRKHKY